MAGQINRGWPLGNMLYELASKPDVRKVLEIGTWRGDGSTLVLATALAETGGHLWTVELKEDNYAVAKDFYARSDMPVTLIHGLSIDPGWYPPFDHYWPRISQTSQEALEPGSYREWYEDELAWAQAAPRTNVVCELVEQYRPFDLVLLDGGEFASDHEFELLHDHINRYVLMDDTNPERCIKNALARAQVLTSPQWNVLADVQDNRNGWLAAQKVADA